MGKGYYDHDIEVKYTEGLLSSSKDWQWFIDATETIFHPKLEMTCFEDFVSCYSEISTVFCHLASIVDKAGPINVVFNAHWLETMHECVLIRTGLKNYASLKNPEPFYRMLAIAAHATYLINCVSGTQYLFNSQLLYVSNLHDLYDFAPLGDKRSDFIESVRALGVSDVGEAVLTLESNFSSSVIPVNEKAVSDILDKNFDEDFLSFRFVDGRAFQTWQESMLCEAFRLSYIRDALEPAIRLRSGEENPDTSYWTSDLINKAIASFSDYRAICMLETIAFLKHGTCPSSQTQELLVTLSLKGMQKFVDEENGLHHIDNTALKVVLQLIECKQLEKGVKADFFRGVNKLLSPVSDYQKICIIKNHHLPCTKEQDSIFANKTDTMAKDLISSASSSHDLLEIFKNTLIARNSESGDLSAVYELFLKSIEDTDAITAELFYWAMQFYIHALDNPNADNKWTKQILISLRHIWQKNYYSQVISSMQTISVEQTIHNDVVKALNEGFLEHPHEFAHGCFLQSDESILETLESMSEHALVLKFSTTTISEYYPEHIHVDLCEKDDSIDRMIVEELLRIYSEKQYRFINTLTNQEIADGFYSNIAKGIQLTASMIDIKPAYEWIASNAPAPYVLLPYPEGHPALGHLMQLFPLLENTIRMIGEMFTIVPFQIDTKKYTRLRDVAETLAALVREIKSITGTIQGCNEFLFVHYVMYSPNGFNIRNECVHGRQFQSISDIKGAFRLTVICTYMMLKRLESLSVIAMSSNDVE